jgi:uncharacterized protein YbdZ (MbtH family)
MDEFTIDGDLFQVLINGKEQYSLWPAAQTPPEGWLSVLAAQPKRVCVAYVEEHWVDMRPLSLRRAMGDTHDHGDAH